MLNNSLHNKFISNLGWVDGGKLWFYDTSQKQPESFPVHSQAKYMGLFSGKNDYFSLVHGDENEQKNRVSIHHFDNPTLSLAEVRVDSADGLFTGDSSLWCNVPELYVVHDVQGKFSLLQIDAASEKASLQDFNWFDDSYDKMYQGIISVCKMPGGNLALVGVQRSSTLIIHDLDNGNKVGELPLGSGHGNPEPYFRQYAAEIWVINYDTLVVLHSSSFEIMHSLHLQPADKKGTGQFLGDFCFNKDEKICLIARPFSNDAVAIDTTTFKISHHAPLSPQPLEIGILDDSQTVIARSWKTGDFMTGQLKRRSWFQKL